MGAEAAKPWQGDVVATGFDSDRAGGEAAGLAAMALALVTGEAHRGALIGGHAESFIRRKLAHTFDDAC
jgi:hypothetical protein